MAGAVTAAEAFTAAVHILADMAEEARTDGDMAAGSILGIWLCSLALAV